MDGTFPSALAFSFERAPELAFGHTPHTVPGIAAALVDIVPSFADIDDTGVDSFGRFPSFPCAFALL